MKEIIYKQDVIDALLPLYHEHEYRIHGKAESYSQYNEAWQDALSMVENVIFGLPSVETERKGHWILSDDRDWKTCSECGADVDVSIGLGIFVDNDEVSELRFCPNCGARMVKEDEEHD